MTSIRTQILGVLAATLLSACGGSDDAPRPPSTKGAFTAVVSFGDSLSDVGAYAPATSLAGNGAAPYFGGKFTTNGAGSTVWVENLATSLGLAVTPAEVGFAGQSVKCPAAAISAALATTCTAYGQGGSRVTDPNGIGKAGGAMTVPVVTQIANHLARFGSFKASDLIFVYVGSNDVFTQFGIFSARATQIQTDAATGKITPDAANVALAAAQADAQAAMRQVATELAGYVKTQILAKGGVYVAVMTLSDIVDTPFGASLPASVRPVLTELSRSFNASLREGLNEQPVQIIDTFPIFKDVGARATALGFTNQTAPACDASKVSAVTGGKVVDGSSLFCNVTPGAPFDALRTGASATTWFFADGVHPTTGGHKAFSDAFAAQLRQFGWI
ncbi:SGNH/GDSL hydrolase family protein [Ideonella sp. A 288]|uniref:SGNH/GDSL hydrolase family protein n=1 Tax=Ideonella sp. A 288 TaxID=1962181 RepID=UPI000B4B1AF5|nr:SGNH/GDSL hydrolase family protein [Ideonella sp. A 288]